MVAGAARSPYETGGLRGFPQQPLPKTQHCPVRKLHAIVPPPSPQPSPPEAGGEGVDDGAGFSNHKALNRFHFFPSPPMGERVRVRGKSSSWSKKCISEFMNSWTTYNENPYFAKTKPDTAGFRAIKMVTTGGNTVKTPLADIIQTNVSSASTMYQS